MSGENASEQTPPFMLEGMTLPNDWLVGKALQKKDDDTGGFFSIGYECSSPRVRRAFLKAIDLYKWLDRSDDVVRDLLLWAQEVQGERDLLTVCKPMDRVVTVLDTGDIRELHGARLHIPVPYIIFERAETTARRSILSDTPPMNAWRLRVLHHVAVGLRQLHSRMIAHQDVKLSNVLIFPAGAGAKISDLGRSVRQGRNIPHEMQDWPGELAYAPPEVIYGFIPEEFGARRFTADLYLLGSITCALFTGVQINAFLHDELPSEFFPPDLNGTYTGSFADVLPHLKDAFERSMARISSALPSGTPYSERLPQMIREWCDPDPRERGHPVTRAQFGGNGNTYGLERYLSDLDLLANKAELFEQRRK